MIQLVPRSIISRTVIAASRTVLRRSSPRCPACDHDTHLLRELREASNNDDYLAIVRHDQFRDWQCAACGCIIREFAR